MPRRYWVSFVLDGTRSFDCVVVVDAPCPREAEQLARACNPGPRRPHMTLEIPPSASSQFDGWLGRRLSAADILTLDPGARVEPLSRAAQRALERTCAALSASERQVN